MKATRRHFLLSGDWSLFLLRGVSFPFGTLSRLIDGKPESTKETHEKVECACMDYIIFSSDRTIEYVSCYRSLV